MQYIIIQAGGKGSRLEILTNNKPKCLVPVNNLPIIFHLFNLYPKAKFKIIADYKKDPLKKYLKTFAKVDYSLIETDRCGTCSGISTALKQIPKNKSLMLVWCDLILKKLINYTDNADKNYIAISKNFECRWSYKNGKFEEKSSKENGVAGLFLFKNKNSLNTIPPEGEFTSWLSGQNIQFERINNICTEVGTMHSYFQNELNKPKSRPFNRIEIRKNTVTKTPVNKQGEKLNKYEICWYKRVFKSNFKNIPEIYGFTPLKTEKIKGKNVYFYSFLTLNCKKTILTKIVDMLKNLHDIYNPVPANYNDCYDVYINKTFERLEKIKHLVPFAKNKNITVNHIKCINIFSIKDKIIKDIKKYYPKEFKFIHGDCTFSNIMIRNNDAEPVLIDPRGYFGKTKCYGDADYDWAKLYYSLFGDYDQFNRKNFSLDIKENSVDLTVVSNNWKDTEEYFFKLISDGKTNKIKKKIKLLHALIWLSLTAYCWEDYDSICGAFYNGLLYLKDYLDETK